MINTEKNNNFDLIIEPNRTTADFLKELLRYRELFMFLAWRDILIRYKQTVIGIAWSVIRPTISMVIFTFVFGRVAKLPNDGVPYGIMVFSAMLPWQYFASAMQESSASLVRSAQLVGKIYFPRIILPTASVIVSAVDFLISLCLLFLLMAWYRFIPSPMIILLPLFFIPVTMTALGIGFWFSALGVRYRDFHHLLPFMVQFGLYVSPVGFSSSIVPERWRLFYSLNPMVGVIDGFRWCIYGMPIYTPGFIISLIISVAFFFSGVRFFRRFERSFADFI